MFSWYIEDRAERERMRAAALKTFGELGDDHPATLFFMHQISRCNRYAAEIADLREEHQRERDLRREFASECVDLEDSLATLADAFTDWLVDREHHNPMDAAEIVAEMRKAVAAGGGGT